jgi:hypothetical protein
MGMCPVVACKLTFWCELEPIAAPHAFLCVDFECMECSRYCLDSVGYVLAFDSNL